MTLYACWDRSEGLCLTRINTLITKQRTPLCEFETNKKMGAVAPTLFGAIKLLVNNQTCDF